jgi:hypothetical protein
VRHAFPCITSPRFARRGSSSKRGRKPFVRGTTVARSCCTGPLPRNFRSILCGTWWSRTRRPSENPITRPQGSTCTAPEQLHVLRSMWLASSSRFTRSRRRSGTLPDTCRCIAQFEAVATSRTALFQFWMSEGYLPLHVAASAARDKYRRVCTVDERDRDGAAPLNLACQMELGLAVWPRRRACFRCTMPSCSASRFRPRTFSSRWCSKRFRFGIRGCSHRCTRLWIETFLHWTLSDRLLPCGRDQLARGTRPEGAYLSTRRLRWGILIWRGGWSMSGLDRFESGAARGCSHCTCRHGTGSSSCPRPCGEVVRAGARTVARGSSWWGLENCEVHILVLVGIGSPEARRWSSPLARGSLQWRSGCGPIPGHQVARIGSRDVERRTTSLARGSE